MFVVFTAPGFVLEVQRTLGDKHQQEKSQSMLCYRLSYTLHYFSHETCKVEKFEKTPPEIWICV